MPFCVGCGTSVQQDYVFCPECGLKIACEEQSPTFDSYSGTYKTCRCCGEKMPEDMFYCLSCGTTFGDNNQNFENRSGRFVDANRAQKRVVDTSEGKWRNKWVALVLCLLFGVFGIHRFYEGKKITGFIYLFTFGLLGYGVVFDLILLATKPNPYRVK